MFSFIRKNNNKTENRQCHLTQLCWHILLAGSIGMLLSSCDQAQKASQTVSLRVPDLMAQAGPLPIDTTVTWRLTVDGKDYAPSTDNGDGSKTFSLDLAQETEYVFKLDVVASRPTHWKTDAPVIVASSETSHYVVSDSAAQANPSLNQVVMPAFDYQSYNNDHDLSSNWQEVKRGRDPSDADLAFSVYNNAAGGDKKDFGFGVTGTQDGGWVVAGHSENATDFDVAVWKFDSSGVLESVFTQDNAAGGNGQETSFAVTACSDGGWIVAGSSWNGTNADMAVWKFTSSGVLDTSFNGDGVFVHKSAAGADGNDYAYGIVNAPGGGWVVVGSSMNIRNNSDMVVWKLTPAGQLDANFYSAGIFTHDNAAGGNANDSAAAIALTSDGGWVVAGKSNNGTNDDMAVWKFNASGQLDTAFSGDGVFTHDNAAGGSGTDWAYGVDGFSSGGWIVTGISSGIANEDMALWKFTATGLDKSFDGDGVFSHDNAAGGNGFDYGRDVITTPDGGWLVAGYSLGPNNDADMAVWKFTSTGQLDTSFFGDGIITHHNAAGGNFVDSAYAITIINDGSYVVIGNSDRTGSAQTDDMVVWQ